MRPKNTPASRPAIERTPRARAEEAEHQSDEQAQPRAGQGTAAEHPRPREPAGHALDLHEVDADDRHLLDGELLVRQVVDGALRLGVGGVRADGPALRRGRQRQRAHRGPGSVQPVLDSEVGSSSSVPSSVALRVQLLRHVQRLAGANACRSDEPTRRPIIGTCARLAGHDEPGRRRRPDAIWTDRSPARRTPVPRCPLSTVTNHPDRQPSGANEFAPPEDTPAHRRSPMPPVDYRGDRCPADRPRVRIPAACRLIPQLLATLAPADYPADRRLPAGRRLPPARRLCRLGPDIRLRLRVGYPRRSRLPVTEPGTRLPPAALPVRRATRTRPTPVQPVWPDAAARVGTSGMAIASLVVSLASLLFTCGTTSFIGADPRRARRCGETKRTGQEGYGLALAGLIIGAIPAVLWIVWLAVRRLSAAVAGAGSVLP